MIAARSSAAAAGLSLAEPSLLDAAEARRLEALFGVLASAPRLRLSHARVHDRLVDPGVAGLLDEGLRPAGESARWRT